MNEQQRVPLSGQTHPSARPEYSTGKVAAGQRLERMVLVLRADPAQEAALEELIRAQQDPDSASYHQWLTPEAYGNHFGISAHDLDQVSLWLQSHGMQVEDVPASRRAIIFSATAGQVESTLHTSIRKYSVSGVRAASTAAAGKSTITISGTGGGLTRTATIAVTLVAPPSFSLLTSVTKLAAARNTPLPITVSTTALNKFKSAIALSVTTLPKGVTATFAPCIAYPGNGSSRLTLRVASTAPVGIYPIRVTATGAAVTKTQILTLTVTTRNPPPFSR